MATRRAETTQQSRHLLVAAATELFSERGYRQTSFEDIATRSGVSRGSIPWHFGNKEGLLAAVVEHVVDTMRAGFGTPEPGPDALDRALRQAVAFTRQPSTRLFITLLAEAVEPGSPLHQRYAVLHEAMRDQVRSWVDLVDLPAGIGAEELSTILMGTLIGIHQQWRIAPDTVDLDATYATVRTLLATGLGVTA
ncbi:TetR/AcrR family transcriptional regulator [Actinokineospora sp. HUAS TT18]|uniref:TetR/AcrR family transcriptional regulator n=1 Tax=Actinokineospora sp. HUAS TT18 TaxID=3447451 RepID=UPI003F51D305